MITRLNNPPISQTPQAELGERMNGELNVQEVISIQM